MEIKDCIDFPYGTPVLSFPAFLKSMNGVDQIGYFVDGAMWMPFVVRKKYFIKWIQLYSPVFGAKNEEEEKSFLNHCVAMATKHLKVSHIITANTALFGSFPDRAEYCKWGSYVVDLTQSEECLFKALHSKHRNVIRKAESVGMKVYCGPEYAQDAVALMNETYARQGGGYAFGTGFINNLNKLGDNVSWWIVKDSDGIINGSAVFVWSRGASCYYLHGGSSSHTGPGAMNLLIWEAMLYMKGHGVSTFDFVGARLTTDPGSKLEGIQRFKSRFGSELKVGYMFRVVCKPVQYALYLVAFWAFKKIKHIKASDPIKEERSKGNF